MFEKEKRKNRGRTNRPESAQPSKAQPLFHHPGPAHLFPAARFPSQRTGPLPPLGPFCPRQPSKPRAPAARFPRSPAPSLSLSHYCQDPTCRPLLPPRASSMLSRLIALSAPPRPAHPAPASWATPTLQGHRPASRAHPPSRSFHTRRPGSRNGRCARSASSARRDHGRILSTGHARP